MNVIRDKAPTAIVVFAGLATAIATLRALWHTSHRWQKRSVRKKLPHHLETWRLLGGLTESVPVWEAVRPALLEAGVELWVSDGTSSYSKPGQTIRANGFAYVPPVRAKLSWSKNLQEFNCQNELTRGGTTLGGLNVVIRVAVIGDEGNQHLAILRKLARGTRSLMTDNHVVPLWNEVRFEDIVFTISPYVGYPMDECYGFWAQNSVGDVVDMILQALEAIAFVHDLGIAHRDLCKSNYLVQWYPESLRTMEIPLTRPRVFLTDFEMAYEFPPETPNEHRLIKGPPREGYRRPTPPEMESGMPYDPFKADIWQLAESLSDFKTTIPEIDAVLENMFHIDCAARLSAVQAQDNLASIVSGIAPSALLIPPFFLNPFSFS